MEEVFKWDFYILYFRLLVTTQPKLESGIRLYHSLRVTVGTSWLTTSLPKSYGKVIGTLASRVDALLYSQFNPLKSCRPR